MVIIVRYETGDEYTWWATEYIPIEFSSPEEAELEFEIAVDEVMKNFLGENKKDDFVFAGVEFNALNHVCLDSDKNNYEYNGPTFITLKNWVKSFKINEINKN